MRHPSSLLLLVAGLLVLTPGCRRRVNSGWGQPYNPNAGYGGGYQRGGGGGYGRAGPWLPVQPAEAGFRCQMPGRAEVRERRGFADDGVPFRTIIAQTQLRFGTFSMASTHWEGGIAGDALDQTQALAERIAEIGELSNREVRRLSVPGYYGREDTGRTSEGAFVAIRQFVGRERLYVAVAVVANQQGQPLRSAELFMESLEFDVDDMILPRGQADVPVPIFVPEVDFAARMPPFTGGDSRQLTVADQELKLRSFESVGQRTYRVLVLELEERPEEGFLDQLAGHLDLGEAQAPTHTSGYPGRAYRSATLRSRAFVTASRVYVLQVSSDAGSDAAAQAFFRSFRIL